MTQHETVGASGQAGEMQTSEGTGMFSEQLPGIFNTQGGAACVVDESGPVDEDLSHTSPAIENLSHNSPVCTEQTPRQEKTRSSSDPDAMEGDGLPYKWSTAGW